VNIRRSIFSIEWSSAIELHRRACLELGGLGPALEPSTQRLAPCVEQPKALYTPVVATVTGFAAAAPTTCQCHPILGAIMARHTVAAAVVAAAKPRSGKRTTTR
jgi:hypothetical protein